MKSFREILEEADKDWARETVEELIEHLREKCMHYDSVHRKFNGGRLSLFCDECGTHISDLHEGTLKIPMRLTIADSDQDPAL